MAQQDIEISRERLGSSVKKRTVKDATKSSVKF